MAKKKISKAQQKAAAAKALRQAKKDGSNNTKEEDEKPAFLRAQEDESLNTNRTRDVKIPRFNMSNPGGGQPLLESTDIQLSDGHRYGLIGPNGMGKTTLLRHLASYTIPEFPRHLRVLHVKQEFLPSGEETVRQYVIKADEELTHLLSRQAALQAKLDDDGEGEAEKMEAVLSELEDVSDRLEHIEADQAEARAAEILVGLQFTEMMQRTPTSSLSGGWRMRVALACALFVQPDILLLDEPTNHLDLPSVLWLTNYLLSYPNTLVVVSHDRKFLNDVCTDMILLEERKLKYFKGDYDTFLRTREEQKHHHNTQAAKNQRVRAANENYIRRFKANAKLATQAQSRVKMLAKMEDMQIIEDDEKFAFKFHEPTPLKKKVVAQFAGVTFGYHGEDPTRRSYLYSNVSCKLEWGDCIALVGANGVGKSTLINMMTGSELAPVEGRVVLNHSARFGYFSQHHMDALNPEHTPFEFLQSQFPLAASQEVMTQLANFNLMERAHSSKIKELSGGQKCRLAFARIAWEKPQVLVLDEPTNHLDFETIDALIKAVKDFKGAVVIVSHDQHLLSNCCTEYWALADKQVKAFFDFEDAKHFCFRPGAQRVEFRHDTTDEVKEYQAQLAAEQKAASADLMKRMESSVTKTKRSKVKSKGPWDDNPINFDLMDRWLALDKEPAVIARSLRGSVPNPNKGTIVSRVSKHVFDNYFDCDDRDFLEEWAPVLRHCCPHEHSVNQLKLLHMAQGCWHQSTLDKKRRAVAKKAVLLTFKELFKAKIISRDTFQAWERDDPKDKTAGKENAKKQLDPFFAALNKVSA